jgi:hypothetical protein
LTESERVNRKVTPNGQGGARVAVPSEVLRRLGVAVGDSLSYLCEPVVVEKNGSNVLVWNVTVKKYEHAPPVAKPEVPDF